jgi:mono/diheme cytochrome c family protein
MLRPAAVVALMALWSVSFQQGCQDLKKSVTHLRYYPIRDMRQTVAPDPQRAIWSATTPVVWGAVPDSLSVPTIGADAYASDTSPYDVAGPRLVAPTSTDGSVARGDSLFHTICWSCHGKTLAGDGPVAAKLAVSGAIPTDLLGESTRGRTDGMIYMYMRHGGALMPSYGNVLSSRDAWSLVHYIRHMQKASPR